MARPVFLKLCSTLLVSAGLVVLFLFDPSTHGFYPGCFFRLVTGLDCPGCGSTRALYHLLHGHVRESLHYNAMLVPTLGAFAAMVWRPRFAQRPWFLWTVIAVLSVWGVVRNLPPVSGGW